MSRPNYGKKFEKQFADDYKRTFPGTFIMRLKDDTSEYYGASKNACDYLCMPKDKLFMVETKCHYDNTFPWSAFSQYDELITYKDCPNVVIGVVIWFIDHDRVIWVPLHTCTKMMEDGLKSVNINKLDGYDYIEIPSKKKRIFMESDYSVLVV